MLRLILLGLGMFLIGSLLARMLRRAQRLFSGGVTCRHCSARNPADARVCRSCGRDLHRESRVPDYTVED
jgi:ribosomal protein L40E